MLKLNHLSHLSTVVRGIVTGIPIAILILASGCGSRNQCSTSGSTAETSGAEVGLNQVITTPAADTITDLAQSFQFSEAATIKSATLKLALAGTIGSTHSLTLTIETNGSSAPSGTALGSASVYISSLSSTAQSVTFTFSSDVSLSANTPYWLHLSGTFAASNTNYVNWYAHDGTGGYDGGQALEKVTSLSSIFSSTYLGSLRDFVFSFGC